MNRELDKAIALLIGWRYQQNAPEGHHCLSNGNDKGWWKAPDWKGWGCAACGDGPPQYSEDGNAMLELIEEMRKRGYEVLIEFGQGSYNADYFSNNKNDWRGEAEANTMPEAVAKAAYRALTGRDYEG